MFIPAAAFVTSDPVNCPITKVEILNTSGNLFNSKCAKVSGGTEIAFQGEYCSENLGIRISSGTYTKVYQSFKVDVQLYCILELSVAPVNSVYKYVTAEAYTAT